MIFKPQLASKVMSGEKTRTWRPGEVCRYQVGKDYAVQPGRGKSAIGRVRVVSIEERTPAMTTPAEAIAEGFESREAFLQYVADLYHAPIAEVENRWGFAIRFELLAANLGGA